MRSELHSSWYLFSETMISKGVILAGGQGTRLDPLTRVVSKQLLPVYDKPMIFYPLALLMRCGIREVLLVTSRDWLPSYRRLLGDGAALGMTIDYAIQENPVGVPDGLVVARDWLAGEGCCFILGDNLFFGNLDPLRQAMSLTGGACIFAVPTREPQRFGIVELGPEGKVLSVEEKPVEPKSDLAIPGVYLFDGSAAWRAGSLQPSSRGETEICDLMESYRREGLLECRRLGRGFVWLDAGTVEGLLEAGNFVATMAHRTGFEVACLEEIAWREGWLTDAELASLAKKQVSKVRREYLEGLLQP
ncbi:glucose-1-phosphate thymidylyltransferase [Roseibacillus persicicus]|uniref:glucose-1-phosphate thymidylyltransferase n=2 Tax=Roseibacillus persicicus TaxID=454148 RepID=A0A918TAQ3_9BACT|nr:glucose-1-phosphate thymidylyltransferase [Roseibacillus persicicus]